MLQEILELVNLGVDITLEITLVLFQGVLFQGVFFQAWCIERDISKKFILF